MLMRESLIAGILAMAIGTALLAYSTFTYNLQLQVHQNIVKASELHPGFIGPIEPPLIFWTTVSIVGLTFVGIGVTLLTLYSKREYLAAKGWL
jgi:hypothetical protein